MDKAIMNMSEEERRGYLEGLNTDQLLAYINDMGKQVREKEERIAQLELEKAKAGIPKAIPEWLKEYRDSIAGLSNAIEGELLDYLVAEVRDKEVKVKTTENGIEKEVIKTEKVWPRWKSFQIGDLRFMLGFDQKKVEEAWKAKNNKPAAAAPPPSNPTPTPPPPAAKGGNANKVSF